MEFQNQRGMRLKKYVAKRAMNFPENLKDSQSEVIYLLLKKLNRIISGKKRKKRNSHIHSTRNTMKPKENHSGNHFQGKLDSLERQMVCYNN